MGGKIPAPLACVLIAVATCSATLCSSGTADADPGAQQVTSLTQQAAQLSSEMLLEQLQVGGYQQQYEAHWRRSNATSSRQRRSKRRAQNQQEIDATPRSSSTPR